MHGCMDHDDRSCFAAASIHTKQLAIRPSERGIKGVKLLLLLAAAAALPAAAVAYLG